MAPLAKARRGLKEAEEREIGPIDEMISKVRNETRSVADAKTRIEWKFY